MNTRQNIDYSVFQQILLFLAAYTSAFAGNTQLLAAIVNFKGFIGAIDAVSAKKQPKASKPQTKMKTDARKSVVSQLEAACLLALEWAKSQKNEQLIKDFTINNTSFKGKINAMIILANYTYGVLSTNKAALIAGTTITALQLTAIGTEIALLQTLQKAPTAARSSQKTVTALYKPAFLDATAGKETLINLIKGAYTIGANANLQLITDLENALVFGGNVQHTILKATFYTAGTTVGIEGATMTITELMRVGVSNILGVAQIAEFIPGVYHVTFSALDHISQTKIMTVTAGEKVNLTVEMVGS